MNIYSVSGVTLRSSVPLPLVSTRSLHHDVEISFERPAEQRSVPHGPPWYTSPFEDDTGQPALKVWTGANGSFDMRYSDGTRFIVERNGARIQAEPRAGASLESVIAYLLGPVLGFVQRLRGTVCLHASAFVYEGRAVALIGEPGAGKSTTVTAMAQRGHPIMADDYICLKEKQGIIHALPSSPTIRLWPDAAQLLLGPSHSLPAICKEWDKLQLDLRDSNMRIQQDPVPLGAVYVLDDRVVNGEPFVRPLLGREGLICLVGNTYTNYLLDPTMRAREFALLGRLIGQAPPRLAAANSDARQLGRFCDLILQDLDSISKSREFAVA